MTSHRILPEALAELDEASTWYEEHEEGLGLDLVREYRERLAFALKMPQTGALAGKTGRRRDPALPPEAFWSIRDLDGRDR